METEKIIGSVRQTDAGTSGLFVRPFAYSSLSGDVEAKVGEMMADARRRETRTRTHVEKDERLEQAKRELRRDCAHIYGQLRRPNLDTELADRSKMKLSRVKLVLRILKGFGMAVECESTMLGTVWEREGYQRKNDMPLRTQH